MNVAAVKPMSFTESRHEKLQKMSRYYETREDYKKNTEEIREQKSRARILIGSCIGGGLLGVITYFAVKIMRNKIV